MGDANTVENYEKDKNELGPKVKQEPMDVDLPDITSNHEASGNLKQSNHCDKDFASSENLTDQKEKSSSDHFSLGQMKKDDSGISICKSQDEDEVDIDKPESSKDEERSSKNLNIEKRNSHELEAKQSEEMNGQSSPDSGNQDASFSLTEFPNDTCEFSKKSSELSSNLETADKKDKQTAKEEAARKKRVNTNVFKGREEQTKVESACDDENSDDDQLSIKSEDVSKMSDSDDEKNYDPTPNVSKPKHKWFLCKEITNRQYGTSNGHSSDLFRFHCGGSLHMIERLELMYKMKNHDGCVNTLHFNSTGTRLASGSDDLNIVIWDWTISKPVLEYQSGHRSNVFQAKFMPFSGDSHIVSCARDGQVRLAELSSTGICKGTRKLGQHRGAAHKLALEMDMPHTFLSCGEDSVVFQVDLREEKPEKLITCKENDRKVALYTIFSNPVNSYEFAIGGRDHFVRIYDKRNIREENPMKKFCPHHLVDSDIRANVTCLVYNYDGSEILASYNDEDIYIFDARHSDGAEYVHKYRGHRNNQTVKGVNYFGPKSEFIVSGSDCGYIYLWEKETEHIVQYLYGDEGGVVNCLEPHPHCPALATSGLDFDVKIWVPSCEHPPDLSELKSKICLNMKEREDDRKRDGPDNYDSQMLWFLMQHLRRTARRRERMEGQEAEESSSPSSGAESDDEDTDAPQAIQCSQS
ncbi:DDB1- and CUL4-associated factor 8-like isoform X1 [Tachypleus tridentatus]|uniref:DDB1- and CUL4-associated factor 8-like isoform X1 n=1 Tax=Tachypleus tridentatus TaxID=6853 RepID=UPI003FD04581